MTTRNFVIKEDQSDAEVLSERIKTEAGDLIRRGPGWARTTDLGFIRTALSPAELLAQYQKYPLILNVLSYFTTRQYDIQTFLSPE